MRRLLIGTAAALALAACDAIGPRPQTTTSAGVATIHNVPPRPAQLAPPPMLQDEAPPPKPKVTFAWETPKVIELSPEDEKLRASLPFSPAIAMDPVDGSKISMRANTPTYEYKGKIYYFQNEANRRIFMGNPEEALKGGFMKL